MVQQSGREYEEAQSVRHSLRPLGEQPLAPTLFRRFANLGRFVAPYGDSPGRFLVPVRNPASVRRCDGCRDGSGRPSMRAVRSREGQLRACR